MEAIKKYIFESIITIAFLACFSMAAWSVKRIVEHETRIVRIESNRFDQKDAGVLKDRVADNEKAIARIETSDKWTRDTLVRLETKIDKLIDSR